MLCSQQRTRDANIPRLANYTRINTTADLTQIVGVALNGVPYSNSVSIMNVDPLYPAPYGIVTNASTAREPLDMCMGRTSQDGIY